MKYFRAMPRIQVSNITSANTLATNLMVRTELLPSLLNNPSLFYKYDVQDGDTPEVIAAKYYGDSYRYWLVMYGNQILDPQWDLPISNYNFEIYLNDKYTTAANANNQTVVAYTQSTVYEYQKIVTTVDTGTGTTSIDTFVIDLDTYNNTPQEDVGITYNIPNGSPVTVTTSRNILNIYDYEVQTNEAKRSINIINSKYAIPLENQLVSLLK
jgi:hypothetical protein